MDRLQRFALTTWAIIGSFIVASALLWLVSQVRVIWLPLVFAFGLTVLLNPAVRAFQRISLPRIVSVVLTFLVMSVSLAALGSLVVPVVNSQASEFGSEFPDLYDQALIWIEATSERFGIAIQPGIDADTVRAWLADPANQESLSGIIDGFGTGAGLLLRGVVEVVSVLVLAPLFAFYLLVDLERTKRLVFELTPPHYRDEARFVGAHLGAALGGFVRGQLLVAIIVGLLSSVTLWLLDLPFWLIIGIAAGVLNLVPFIGPVFGGALAAVVALLEARPATAAIAVGAFMLIQQIDNHLITPLVQRARVKLSPLVIVLALLVGGALGGLLGVLVAVPAVATLRIVAGHLWRTRILGESWDQASEAMIELTPPPDRLLRRKVEEQRLFDTTEMKALTVDEPAERD